MCFSPYSGIGWRGGVSPKGLVQNLQFFTLGGSNIEVLETYLFDMVII